MTSIILFYFLLATSAQQPANFSMVSITIDSGNVAGETLFNDINSFLSENVSNGKVLYAQIKSDRGELDTICKKIAAFDLSAADKNTRTALYLNAYNLLVIKSVIDHYPLSSPLDVNGFFDKQKFTIAGEVMTLNDLESKKLRPDARVHFALVCGAKGCPKLQSKAYLPATVQKQLDEAATKAINDPQFLRVDYTNKQVQLSKIFEWYREDFVKASGSELAFINTYRTAKIPDTYGKSYYEYDWSLNK